LVVADHLPACPPRLGPPAARDGPV
jgi:hypothetical protein